MKQAIGFGTVLFVGLLVAVLVSSRNPLREEAAKAEALADSAMAEHLATEDSLKTELAVLRDSVTTLNVVIDSGLAVAGAGAARRDSVITVIARDAGADSLLAAKYARAGYDSAVANEVEPLRVVVSALFAQVATYEVRDSLWKHAYAVQGKALTLSRRESAAWERAAQPETFLGMGPKTAFVAGMGTLATLVIYVAFK